MPYRRKLSDSDEISPWMNTSNHVDSAPTDGCDTRFSAPARLSITSERRSVVLATSTARVAFWSPALLTVGPAALKVNITASQKPDTIRVLRYSTRTDTNRGRCCART